MAKKEYGFRARLARKMKRLSITTTLIVNLIYIGYLAYSLKNDVGIKEVNIALIIGTAVFMVASLFFKLIGGRENLKTTKRFYKRFKLVTKLFSSATAIYSLITAAKAVSPFAMILSTIGAGFLVLRLITELLGSLVSGKARRIKADLAAKRERRKNQKVIDSVEPDDEPCPIYDTAEDNG